MSGLLHSLSLQVVLLRSNMGFCKNFENTDLEKVISEDLVLDGDSHSGPEVILAVVSSDVNAALMMNLDWHRGQLIPEVLTDNNFTWN